VWFQELETPVIKTQTNLKKDKKHGTVFLIK
jgi:hypothetical protein